jgi:hypothetical protein
MNATRNINVISNTIIAEGDLTLRGLLSCVHGCHIVAGGRVSVWGGLINVSHPSSLSARSLRMHNASIRAGEGLEVSVDEDVDLAGGSSIAGAGLVHISAGAGINMSSSSIAARRARISAGGDVVLSSSAIAAAEINVTAVGRVRLREDDEITGSMMVVVEGQAIEVSGGRVWSQAIRLRAGEAVRLVSAEVDASSNVSVAAGSIELAGSWCGCRAAGCLVEMAGVDDVVLRSAARVEASDVVLHAFDIAIHSDCAEGPLLPACASSVSASGRGWRAASVAEEDGERNISWPWRYGAAGASCPPSDLNATRATAAGGGRIMISAHHVVDLRGWVLHQPSRGVHGGQEAQAALDAHYIRHCRPR